MKVLVSAYACEPGKGSEPEVGWRWVQQLSRYHNLWVITRANNRLVIEAALRRQPMPNTQWIYFDLPNWMKLWKKGQRGIHLYYLFWQYGAYKLARVLHQRNLFDVVHHVTIAIYWMPSFMYRLSIPFIWGPVGGGDRTPKAFLNSLSFKGRFTEHLRDVVIRIAEYQPALKQTAKHATMALASTPVTAERLQKLGASNITVLSQVGLGAEELAHFSNFSIRNTRPFRWISVGNLIALKGFHLSLEAFAQFKKLYSESEYWIIGDGAERQHLTTLAMKMGVMRSVRFWGRLSREETLYKISECDVFVFPSLHDSGGIVCAEAMAVGRPVVCLNLGGPALQVTEETGYCIPAHSPEQVVEDMTKALYTLATNPELRKRMGEAARRRVREHFSWEKKGELMNRLYREIVAES